MGWRKLLKILFFICRKLILVFYFSVSHRTHLPVPMFSRNDFSIWSVLKNCIGKELSKITMPVIFNEPLSFLQRMVEYMEYAYLLRKASEQVDPIDRMKVGGQLFFFECMCVLGEGRGEGVSKLIIKSLNIISWRNNYLETGSWRVVSETTPYCIYFKYFLCN